MKYTRTALGLLTRQYRSVLKKCWLINVGLFALGAAGVMVSNEAEAASAHDVAAGTVVGSIIDSFTNTTYSNEQGKFINNKGSIDYIRGSVSGNTHNSSSAFGGLVYNSNYIGIIAGNYANNTVNAAQANDADDGGVISNIGGTIDTINASFTGNTVTNTGTSGNPNGMIYSRNGYINHIYGSFANNVVTSAVGDSTYGVSSAAITVDGAVLGDINASFSNNRAVNTGSTKAVGGAILLLSGGHGNPTVKSISGTFTGNYAQAASGFATGGAIQNNGTIADGIINATFSGNYAKSTGNYARGGAIYSSNAISITNSTFTGNYISGNSESHGGAIYSAANLTIKATDGGQTKFSGNYVNTASNNEAIWADSRLFLVAEKNGTIVMDDKINGKKDYELYIRGDGSGVVELNDTVKAQTSVSDSTVQAVNMVIEKDANLKIGRDDVLDNNNLMWSGYLDMRNGLAGTMALNTLNRSNSNAKMAIDVDLGSGTADSISALTHDGTTNITIDAINLPSTKYSDSGATVTVNVTPDDGLMEYLQLSDDIMANISGNNYYTEVEYDADTGSITFSDKLINQSTLDTQLNNYYTKYGLGGKISAANDNHNDNIILMPTSRASVRVFARGVAPQLGKINSHPEAWQNMTRHPEKAHRADVGISSHRFAALWWNNTAISLTTADARRRMRLPRPDGLAMTVSFLEAANNNATTNRVILNVMKDPATPPVLFVPAERMDTSALPQYDGEYLTILNAA